MQDQIWITILDAERLARYYGRLSTKYNRVQFWLNVGVTICSLAAATVLLINVHKAVPAALFLVVSSGTTWGIFAGYSKKATLSASAAKECAKLKSDSVELWYDQHANDVTERAIALARRLDDITPMEIEQNVKLNVKCAEEAYETVRYEFRRT